MKNLLLIPAAILMSSCALFSHTKDVNVIAKAEAPVVIHPNPPDQLSMREVTWTIYNREKLEKYLAEHPGDEIVLYTLTPKGYENLSLDMQEIIRYISDQKNIILFYRKSFPSPDQKPAE